MKLKASNKRVRNRHTRGANRIIVMYIDMLYFTFNEYLSSSSNYLARLQELPLL